MRTERRILIDTSVLIRFFEDSPTAYLAKESMLALAAQGAKFVIVPQVLIEMRAVLTRPVTSNGLGFSSQEADTETDIILDQFEIEPETDQILACWLNLVSRHRVLGKNVHDARLAAHAISSGIEEILTLNPRHYTRFAEVAVLTPDDFALG